jgi:hypothetical protein
MDKRAIARRRLASQRLAGNGMDSAEAVVGWLGAVQSQEYGLAKWSLGKRASDLTDGAVDALMTDGRIVRTHILRPTWHFVLPTDIRWMMALTGPRIRMQTGRRYIQLGLDESVLRRAMDVIGTALAGGRRRTRPQLRANLAEAGIDVDAPQLGYILMQAELELLVCSGGLDGRQQTYALLDDLVPAAAPMDREQALGELTRRYFRSHGPAAIADFTWWSSLTVADARRGLQVAGPALERLDIDGTAYWFDPSIEVDQAASPVVHLLQPFDEYVVGYQRTRSVMDPAGLTGPGTWNPNSFTNAAILDGQVVAGWRRVPKRSSVMIEVAPLRPLSGPERDAVEVAVERYGEFLGVPVMISWPARVAASG